MHPLFQRLREMDWDTFQRFACQLLSEKHPGLHIQHVSGAGGDRGLDVFVGELADQPGVWQCKYFPNGLGPRQRPQVTHSLRTAVKHFKPRQWVLVIPCDLDDKGHVWFQKIQRAYAEKVSIGLLQASHIVRELVHRRSLRDAFFPGAIFDSIEVARYVTSVGNLSPTDVNRLAQRDVNELISRLEAEDARFNYMIRYGPNVGHEISSTVPSHPLLIASIRGPDQQVDVFARDLDALKIDPPKIQFGVKTSGLNKINEFFRTGRKQELTADEISKPKTTFDFLLPEGRIDDWKLVLMPREPHRKIPVRLTFTKEDAEPVVYEYLRLVITRMGTEEVELQSDSSNPFVLTFCFGTASTGAGSLTVRELYTGAEVRAVAKATAAFRILRSGGDVEVYSLEQGAPIGSITMIPSNADQNRIVLEEMVRNAADVANQYGLELRLPKRVARTDMETIGFLLAAAAGAEIQAVRFDAKLVKTKEHEQAVVSRIKGKFQMIAHGNRLEPMPRVFGTPVDTGPVVLIAKDCEAEDRKQFLKAYRRARYGEAVQIGVRVSGARVQRLKPGELLQPPSIYVKPGE